MLLQGISAHFSKRAGSILGTTVLTYIKHIGRRGEDMTARGILAAFVTAGILLAGALVVLAATDQDPAHFVRALTFNGAPNALVCFFIAVGSILSAVFACLSCIGAFSDFDDDGEEDFPFAAIPFFIILSLGLFWFALACGAHPMEAEDVVEPAVKPIAVPAPEFAKSIDVNKALDAEEAIPVEDDAAPNEDSDESDASDDADNLDLEGFSTLTVEAASWPYKHPLVRDGVYERSNSVDRYLASLFPAEDADGKVRALLCGNAWVGITGASSEEGPALRNQTRAEARALLAAQKAKEWLASQDNCDAPIVLGVDLGQHQATADAINAADTDYQRQTLMFVRTGNPDAPKPSAGEALAELQEFLDFDVVRDSLLANREYREAPRAFLP